MTTPSSRISRNGRDVAEDWQIDERTIYLNHGSYGPAPLPVREARRQWQDRLESQPMDFYSRHLEDEWFKARDLFAMFINATPSDLAFVENATTGMNLVAHSFPLRPGDIVALTDHEYGAVQRIWQKACDDAGAQIFTVRFPERLESEQQWVSAMIDQLPPETRLIVVSHITSATALILPVVLLCREASKRGIPVCIDGPHAPLHVDIDMANIGCAFYAASCHKWLCAPFGSGFLWVDPDYQQTMRPLNISWGRHMPRLPETWVDQLVWTGTRDYSAFLSVPTAIEYFRELGVESVRQHNLALADYARKRLGEAYPGHPIAPLNQNWYGMMAHHPLPPGDARSLQTRLWEEHHIEVPIIAWQGKRYARVSCHLYNTHEQIDQFIGALEKLIYEE